MRDRKQYYYLDGVIQLRVGSRVGGGGEALDPGDALRHFVIGVRDLEEVGQLSGQHALLLGEVLLVHLVDGDTGAELEGSGNLELLGFNNRDLGHIDKDGELDCGHERHESRLLLEGDDCDGFNDRDDLRSRGGDGGVLQVG